MLTNTIRSTAFCEELYVFISVSPKRITLFESFQLESIKRLENLSKTRWTTRGPALKVVLEKNQELKSTLKLLAEDKSVEIRSKARGLLKKIQDPDLLFDLPFTSEMASVLEHCSKLLQKKSLTAEEAHTSLGMAKIFLD